MIIVILLAHGTEFWRKINPILLNFIRKHVEIWAVSQFTKDSLIENHKLKKEKVIVVNNCIDPNFKIPDTLIKPKSLIDRYQLSPNQPILLTLCRIIGYEQPKGYDLVLNILPGLIEDFPKIHYFVSGKIDIQEKNRLEVLIRQLKIEEHVTLTGFISEKELTDHYLLADIFIMPSKKEGFGLVFIEAVSCGCKVIAGNQDGSVDALLNGKIGTLVNPDHPDEIKLALTHHLNCINQEKQMIINQKICIDHFGHEKYKEKIKSLLQ
ncbi:MAG: glycosyltransferase [Pedobacter sp.]|nr:MAG: glycosyltransferase [Pedobacter sp.]